MPGLEVGLNGTSTALGRTSFELLAMSFGFTLLLFGPGICWLGICKVLGFHLMERSCSVLRVGAGLLLGLGIRWSFRCGVFDRA